MKLDTNDRKNRNIGGLMREDKEVMGGGAGQEEGQERSEKEGMKRRAGEFSPPLRSNFQLSDNAALLRP